MRASLLGLMALVLAAPRAKADPTDPPPPEKPAPIKPVAAQEMQPAPPAEPAPPAAAPHLPSLGPDLADCHNGPAELWWVQADYLLWWMKNGPLPVPVLTAGSAENGGVLGAPDTKVLLGNSSLDYGRMSGIQFGGGGWLDDRHLWGLEAGGFVLERRSVHASFASDANGNPVLARPINDALSDFAPDVAIVALPDTFAGAFSLSSSSRLWGTEANLLRNLYASPRFRADLVLGFRYLDLSEDLELVQQTQALAGGEIPFLPTASSLSPLPVSSVNITDAFHTRNQVYAGQLGMRFEGHFGSGFVGVTTKVALGPNHETIDAMGTTTAQFTNGTSQTVAGGLLALPGTNIGRANNNPFVIAPQLDVKVGYQIADWLQIYAGYDFLFINEVVRPGNSLNLNVNTALVPTNPNFGAAVGPNVPPVSTKKDDFWAQGIHFGFELRY
jgi:hypothetical protein